MASFSELLPACYYLIQENENSRLELVYVLMATDKAVLIEYQDEDQTLAWFKKTDGIYEITEQLTEEQAVIFESIFDEDEEEEDMDWESFENDIDPWFGDDDDSDTDDKIKALNN
jgi:hypothetical protein